MLLLQEVTATLERGQSELYPEGQKQGQEEGHGQSAKPDASGHLGQHTRRESLLFGRKILHKQIVLSLSRHLGSPGQPVNNR